MRLAFANADVHSDGNIDANGDTLRRSNGDCNGNAYTKPDGKPDAYATCSAGYTTILALAR